MISACILNLDSRADRAQHRDLGAVYAKSYVIARGWLDKHHKAFRIDPAPTSCLHEWRLDAGSCHALEQPSDMMFCFVTSRLWDGYGLDNMNEDDNAANRRAYWDFVASNSTNPEFEGKFVAFVHGNLEGDDRSRSTLISRMYDKFGNVHMYVGRSSGVMDVATVSPTVLCLE